MWDAHPRPCLFVLEHERFLEHATLKKSTLNLVPGFFRFLPMCLCVCVRPYIFKCACVLSCRVRMHVCVYVWETVCLYVHVCVLCKRTVCACMCI